MRRTRVSPLLLPPPPFQEWIESTAADGSVFTSGEWTTTGGTWSSDGTKFSTTSPGVAHTRALRKTTEASLTDYRYGAVDAEVLVPASGFVGTGTQFIGVLYGPAAAGTGGAVLQIASNNTLQIERDALAAIASTAFTPTAGTWYRLSLLINWATGVVWGYKDGVLIHTAVATGSAQSDTLVPGIKAYSTAASFRNFKAWRFDYAALPPVPF